MTSVFKKDCAELRMHVCVCLIAGTFTLSNLGMFGVDRFDAILPPGEVYEISMSLNKIRDYNSAYLSLFITRISRVL